MRGARARADRYVSVGEFGEGTVVSGSAFKFAPAARAGPAPHPDASEARAEAIGYLVGAVGSRAQIISACRKLA